SYQNFTTVVPPDGDPTLLPLLQKQGVEISATDTSTSGSLIGTIITLAATFLPVLLLVGLILFSSRQVQRSQQGIFGFGQSKARLYNEEKPSVTFADVAGEDDARIELTGM